MPTAAAAGAGVQELFFYVGETPFLFFMSTHTHTHTQRGQSSGLPATALAEKCQ